MGEVVEEDAVPDAGIGTPVLSADRQRRQRTDRQDGERDWDRQGPASDQRQSRNPITLLISRRTNRSAAISGPRSR